MDARVDDPKETQAHIGTKCAPRAPKNPRPRVRDRRIPVEDADGQNAHTQPGDDVRAFAGPLTRTRRDRAGEHRGRRSRAREAVEAACTAKPTSSTYNHGYEQRKGPLKVPTRPWPDWRRGRQKGADRRGFK